MNMAAVQSLLIAQCYIWDVAKRKLQRSPQETFLLKAFNKSQVRYLTKSLEIDWENEHKRLQSLVGFGRMGRRIVNILGSVTSECTQTIDYALEQI